MGLGFHRFLLWGTSIMCLINVSLEFNPVDNYLIDCGSSTDTQVGDRLFLSDNSNSNNFSIPNGISISTTSSRSISSSTFDLVLYQTARILNGPSSYRFPINKQGWHWIRLYFSPFATENYDLGTANFSVLAQNITLLKDFQLQNGSVVKEYSLDVVSDSLVLTFVPSVSSFAFLNALEVISLPDELIPDGATAIEAPGRFHSLQRRALETVARVNMGNQTVLPQNDTLWRLWVRDGTFLGHVNVKFVLGAAVNYTGQGPTPNIAPPSVYGTATRLDTQDDPHFNANMTWSFNADPGFEYLVRFHFCDIVSEEPDKLFFSVYLNSGVVSNNLDLTNQTSKVLGAPFYMDVVTRLSNGPQINVSVGPSKVGNPERDGILNGLEIMKISNSKGSLAEIDGEIQPSTSSSSKKIRVILGVVIAVVFIAIVLALIVFLVCRRKRRRRLALVGHSTPDHLAVAVKGSPQSTASKYQKEIMLRSKMGYQFPLLAILEATDNFSENLVVGVGGFGKVYKGILRDETKVAVKRGNSQSQQGLAEFRTEIEMLSQFRHRHLVSLIGYCDEKNEMIIIYEYMEHGTLRNHLYDSDLPRLSWRQRLEICIGSARGLHYLHTGSSKAIIHRDVKSANILLDENLMAKVADFGLSKIGPDIDQTHVSTMVKGSFGYLDPEYLITQQLTEKSDVYSFGVVMFEILCGRPVIDPSLPREKVNLVDWARKWEKRGELREIVDPHLADQVNPESLRKFVETAEKCLAERSTDRPPMGDVLWNLESALQLQEKDERSDSNSGVSNSQIESSISITQYSIGSVDDIAGISMSKVFSQMVKADIE